jgi:branched-chain amino acid transport system substrate-binding protein
MLSTIGAVAAGSFLPRAQATTVVGVTDTEIKIGNTCPYSGPASAYGPRGRLRAAFFRRVNDQGGIGGRKINFISYDDAYSPPKGLLTNNCSIIPVWERWYSSTHRGTRAA